MTGATWAPGGKPVAVFVIVIKDDRILEIDVVMDRAAARPMDVEIRHN